MFAGQETTIDAIGNSVLALLQNPLQQKRLRDDPELIPNAIEELLRYNSPLQMSIIRVAAEDVELGGKLIRRGDSITAVLGAANRDPEQFVNPDQLEITRNFAGRNVIFGQGIHNCPGAFLARLELQIVLATLLRRTRSIALTSDRLHWRDNIAFRGLTQLPVSFRAA
jgi:cytochrome P450